MSESPESLEWKQRWSPAYEWETLVGVLEFRHDACKHFFKVERYWPKNFFEPTDPSDRQRCAGCQKGSPHDCLFFHPSLATIFLDIIRAFGKTKMGSAVFSNTDLLDRVFSILPAHYTELGHPCERGGIWACVLDKLHQTFPRELFMMHNIRALLQKEALEKEAYLRSENLKLASDAAAKKSEPSATDSHLVCGTISPTKTCGCRFYFEGDCSIYEEYTRRMGVGKTSQAYADYRSRKMSIGDYLELLRDKMDSEWDSSPLCTAMRLRVFYHTLCRQHCYENRAKEAAVVAAKKASAAKYKQSKLRPRTSY